MTTAHRATFVHAKGTAALLLKTYSSLLTHKRSLPAHTQLKYRRTKKQLNNNNYQQEDQNTNQDYEKGHNDHSGLTVYSPLDKTIPLVKTKDTTIKTITEDSQPADERDRMRLELERKEREHLRLIGRDLVSLEEDSIDIKDKEKEVLMIQGTTSNAPENSELEISLEVLDNEGIKIKGNFIIDKLDVDSEDDDDGIPDGEQVDDYEEDEDEDDNNEDEDVDSEQDEEDSDSDSEAALQLELEKLKRERREKEEQQQQQQIEEEARQSNPLLQFTNKHEDNDSVGDINASGLVKRGWRDGTLFGKKKQRITEKNNEGQGYVNDMIQSEFHKRFLDRYVR